MKNMQSPPQRGAVLLVTLIFLLLLSLVAATAMGGATTELRMTANEQARLDALAMAQSIADGVLQQRGSLPLAAAVGFTDCSDGIKGCDRQGIVIAPAVLEASKRAHARVMVERLSPALSPAPRNMGSSMDAFQAARFQVDAEYDGSAMGEGRAGIVQGAVVLLPRSAQTN